MTQPVNAELARRGFAYRLGMDTAEFFVNVRSVLKGCKIVFDMREVQYITRRTTASVRTGCQRKD